MINEAFYYDKTKQKWEKIGNDFMVDTCPVGSYLLWSTLNRTPAGYLPADGRSLTKTDYPELFDIIGYTYGGSGNNFNLPKFDDGRVVPTANENRPKNSSVVVLIKAKSVREFLPAENNVIASEVKAGIFKTTNTITGRAVDKVPTEAAVRSFLDIKPLPLGDLSKAGFWRALEPGKYWLDDNAGYVNNPNSFRKLSFVDVITYNKTEYEIVIMSKGYPEMFRAGFNSSVSNETTISFTVFSASVNPNLLMNSDFSITERFGNNNGIENVSNNGFLTDRWRFFDGNGQSKCNSRVVFFSNKQWLAVKTISTNTGIILTQDIENTLQFKQNEYYTLSFDIKSEIVLTGITGQLHFYNGAQWNDISFSDDLILQKDKEYHYQGNILLNMDISPAPGKTIKDTYFRFQIPFNNSVNGSLSKTIYISNVKLERGRAATPWVPYGGTQEADRGACLRYFERIRKRQHFTPYIKTDNSEYFIDVNYKVQKRIDNPTINFDVDGAMGLKKGDISNGIYIADNSNMNNNKDGVLIRTKIKNNVAYIDNITIDTDF